ncbi:uncharacterized protein LOC133495454 isoform X2 [Syngnathoides biaculeatus]|uniref:uncharacterized protein LOC133495454 isoform X2 n=1 Tax=Syngnathoides biaculeatus TaxID=300417 RepID=UPI002ADDEE86|nr:uncharacterized protein LOC133495454 isoform X2 [Syngnathoides biaculeatus]
MAANERLQRHLSRDRHFGSLVCSCRVGATRVSNMGPGLAARFSWLYLLFISSAASVPVQQKYYRSGAGPASPPESLRPPLMSLQQKYSSTFLAGPTPGSQSPSSPATPSAASSGHADRQASLQNSKTHWSPPVLPGDHANAPASDSSRSSYEPASGNKPSNAGTQVANPGGLLHHSWALYGPVQERLFEADPKGQSPAYPGDDLPPSWELYNPVYAPPSSYEFPSGPLGTAKGQPTVSPGGNSHHHLGAYSPFDVTLSGHGLPPGGVKGTQAANPVGDLHPSWDSFNPVYVGPPSYETQSALRVPSGSVQGSPLSTGKEQREANEGGKLAPVWTVYSPVYSPPPAAPASRVSGRGHPASYSPVLAQPSGYKPSTGVFVKGKPAVSPGSNLAPSWAAYGQVYEPPSSYKPPNTPSVPPGAFQEPLGSNPGGNLHQSWAGYSSVDMQPSSHKHSSGGGGKGQAAVNPSGNLRQGLAAYGQVQKRLSSKLPTATVVPPSGVKGNHHHHHPGTVKGDPAVNHPGDHLTPRWPTYSKVFEPSGTETLTAPELSPGNAKVSPPGTGAEQSVFGPRRNLGPGWTKVGQLAHFQSHKTPLKYKHPAGGVKLDTGKEQLAASSGSHHQHPNWRAHGQFRYPLSGGGLLHGTGKGQQKRIPGVKRPTVPSPTREPLSGKPGRGVEVGQSAVKPVGDWHAKWTGHGPAYAGSAKHKPSVTPVHHQEELHLSFPSGTRKESDSYSSKKQHHVWATPDPSDYDDASAPPVPGHQTSVQVSGKKWPPAQGPLPLPVRPYPQVDFIDAASGLQGSDSAGVPDWSHYWNFHQWGSGYPGHPGKGLDQIPLQHGAPWVSSHQAFAEEDDGDDDDDEEDDNLPTYVIRNRNGYQQERKEFSRMHYSQNYGPPYVPYQRAPRKA